MQAVIDKEVFVPLKPENLLDGDVDHTYIFCHINCQNLIGHGHNPGTRHSVVDFQLQNQDNKSTSEDQTNEIRMSWIETWESADSRTHCGGWDDVVSEKLHQLVVTLQIQSKDFKWKDGGKVRKPKNLSGTKSQ